MVVLASICIPVGPYHRDIAQRAIASAHAQTIPCDVRVLVDEDGQGAGWCRNRLAADTDSLFVVFLDADDQLEPTFVEDCISAYDAGYYVYTNWYEDGVEQHAPENDEWVAGVARLHLVTTLLPTVAFRQVGGFDEKLPGIEDQEFYLKLRAFGWCGKRLEKPLLHYHPEGQRSHNFMQNPQKTAIRNVVMNRWKDQIIMGCCGGNPPPQADSGERLLGDVLVEALYAPSTQFGVNGRFYKRTFYQGQQLWIAPEDLAAFPNRWRLVRNPANEAPAVDLVRNLALAALNP